MTTLQFTTGAQSVRGSVPAEDFAVVLGAVHTQSLSVPGTASTPTIKDLTYQAVSAASSVAVQDVVVSNAATNPEVSLVSETPLVCEVDALGNVNYVTAGECSIIAQGQTGKRRITQELVVAGAATIYEDIISVGAGSLRKYLIDQQAAALADVAPGSSAQRAFSGLTTGGTGTAGNGGVNTANFIRAQAKAGFDALPLDALDALITEGADGRWRAWISPHHYLTWQSHYTTPATVVGSWIALPSLNSGRWEAVVKWSSAAWGGELCRLMPSNYRTYLPLQLGTHETYIPIWHRAKNTFVTGDERWVMPADYVASPYSSSDPRSAFQRVRAKDGALATGGDSGSPGFVGINGKLVAWGHTAWEGGVCTEAYHDHRAEIDAAMNLLATQNSDPTAGTYAALTVDLSGFTAYP